MIKNNISQEIREIITGYLRRLFYLVYFRKSRRHIIASHESKYLTVSSVLWKLKDSNFNASLRFIVRLSKKERKGRRERGSVTPDMRSGR